MVVRVRKRPAADDTLQSEEDRNAQISESGVEDSHTVPKAKVRVLVTLRKLNEWLRQGGLHIFPRSAAARSSWCSRSWDGAGRDVYHHAVQTYKQQGCAPSVSICATGSSGNVATARRERRRAGCSARKLHCSTRAVLTTDAHSPGSPSVGKQQQQRQVDGRLLRRNPAAGQLSCDALYELNCRDHPLLPRLLIIMLARSR